MADEMDGQDTFEDATSTAVTPMTENPPEELPHQHTDAVEAPETAESNDASEEKAEKEDVKENTEEKISTEVTPQAKEQTPEAPATIDTTVDRTVAAHDSEESPGGSRAQLDGAVDEKTLPDLPGHARTATLESIPNFPPPVPARGDSLASPMKGLSGDLPPLSFPPPPIPPEKPLASPPIPATRKVSSPFGWFSRARKAAPSPERQPNPRRTTAGSMASLGSNADAGHGEDRGRSVSPSRPNRSSLKDRFQILRSQEEHTERTSEEEQTHARTGSVASPTREQGMSLAPPPAQRTLSMSAIPSSPNTKLPPGTASGMSVGPTDHDGPVNWDLWQTLVYEGPAAVARTSGQELNHAIANGIPQPLRGVVWQVLAQSKDKDLESIYRELVAVGTDKEGRPNVPRTNSSGPLNGLHEKESTTSSASSVHSEASTPATSNMTGSPKVETAGADPTVKYPPPGDTRTNVKDDPAALQKLEKTIRRDLGARTSYSKYLMSAGLQDGLFNVCKAYALYDSEVGYAQGMNFIAMPLLFNMPEEEAFTLFCRLMSSKYNLRSLFTAEMPGLHLHLYQFERLLEAFEPALYCHLHRRGVTPTLYATQWFLTLFAYRFPLQLVLRIYDLIFSEGLSAILKFGIVLMQKNAQTLLTMRDMSQLTTYLKERLFDVYIDKSPSASSLLESGFFGSAGGVDREVYHADDLVRDACAVNFTPETLAAYAAEFEEKTRAEKDREAELESLRSANAALLSRVKVLEDRAQQHDAEHVGIASELVRTKVENEALQDANEGLNTQVRELKSMVDRQPAEVEERLREEMERIMTRNIEVQNENRALEEASEEVERELVATKMGFAQVSCALS